MSLLFDGDWSAPAINGAPVFRYDVPENPRDPTALEFPMLSRFSVYSLPSSGSSTFFAGMTWYISGDSGFSDEGGGVWGFIREWIRKPSSVFNYEVYAANYPGIRGTRDPQLLSQTSKVEVNFFLIQTTGGDFTSPDLIPITSESRVEYLETNKTAPLLSNVYLATGFFGFQNTDPSPATYDGWITADAASVTSYSIQAEPSGLMQVRGPLWRRENRKVKAK